jgi:hypothetical protein
MKNILYTTTGKTVTKKNCHRVLLYLIQLQKEQCLSTDDRKPLQINFRKQNFL